MERARTLTQEMTIMDGHIDLPYRMTEFPGPTIGGDFDFPRAATGGLNAPFMSIYIAPAKISGAARRTPSSTWSRR